MIRTRARVTAIPALLAAGFLASIPGALKVAAEGEATPSSGDAWADLGLPELNLVFTPDAIDGIPESLEAGRYLLNIGGEPGPEDYALSAMIMQLPEGMTMDDAMAQAEGAADAPPAFYYDAVLAGGVGAVIPAGHTSATSIIDLTPGEWLIAGGQFSRPPVMLTVTGEMPADLPEPESNATLTMDEMTIELTDGALLVGENLIKSENIGAQPHFIEILMVPEGTTVENIDAAIQQEMGGTPEAEPLNLEEAMPGAFISEQSTGITAWASVTMEAGTYAAMCWVLDPETGMPHAMMGMYQVFVIE